MNYKKRKVKLNDPVYRAHFDVTINSSKLSIKDKMLLNEQIIAFSYSASRQKIQKDYNFLFHQNINIEFNLNIANNKIQPLSILERMFDKNIPFDIELDIHNRIGTIIRKVYFEECSIEYLPGIDCFSYNDTGIFDSLNVQINCKSVKTYDL